MPPKREMTDLLFHPAPRTSEPTTTGWGCDGLPTTAGQATGRGRGRGEGGGRRRSPVVRDVPGTGNQCRTVGPLCEVLSEGMYKYILAANPVRDVLASEQEPDSRQSL
ncbi:hypothetical protein GQ53DRAFT_435577 [Thozetella sp. PMI_491]|nr:hypothetical protein GQ53DRAFT_435577 [Thozetella sp. PMI_491]